MSGDLWSSFEHDPRDPAHARLRAGHLDRSLVCDVLAAAYADGRLDREEHDDRVARAAAARTLGELPPLVDDLVSPTATSRTLEQAGEEHWRERRRSALFGFLTASLVAWTIYLAIHDFHADLGQHFPWPFVVMAFAALNVARTVTGREEIVREEVRRLAKREAKQAKQLRRRRLDP